MRGCAGLEPDLVVGRVIPVAESTSGLVFRNHTPRSVPNLAVDLSDGLDVEFGPALTLPILFRRR